MRPERYWHPYMKMQMSVRERLVLLKHSAYVALSLSAWARSCATPCSITASRASRSMPGDSPWMRRRELMALSRRPMRASQTGDSGQNQTVAMMMAGMIHWHASGMM